MTIRQEARASWRGVLSPIVTPFAADGSVDLDVLRHNVTWLFDRGAKAGNTILLAAGSGGDFPTMDIDERKRVIAAIADVNAGRVPIIAGVQALDIRDVIELSRFAEREGIDAVQISGPFYYDGRPQDVEAWFGEVASQTSVGFAVYNNWYTGYDMPIDLIERLLDVPNAIAVKWASPSMDIFTEGIYRFRDRVAVVNNTLDAVYGHLIGCSAFVSHWPNFYPEFPWTIGDLLDAGRHADAQAYMDVVMRPYRSAVSTIARATAGEGVFVRPLMTAAGLDGGRSRLPSRDDAVSSETRERLSSILEEARIATEEIQAMKPGPLTAVGT